MKKPMQPLSPESFEAVCQCLEQRQQEFISTLSDGGIPSLRNAEWTARKKRIAVCSAEPDGRKKRIGFGPRFSASAPVNRTAAEAVWKKFKQFGKESGLCQIERFRNNEKELGRFDFRATDPATDDQFSCRIHLPGEWNSTGIQISMVVGPRFRNADL